MQSTDREILLEINGRLIRLESRMDKLESRMDKLESRMDKLESRMEILTEGQNALRVSHAEMRGEMNILLWAGGICFAVLAALITFVGIYVPMIIKKSAETPAVIPSVTPTVSLDAVERIITALCYESSKSEEGTRS